MLPPAPHRELLLPSPTPEPSGALPLPPNAGSPFSLEIHRDRSGRVRFLLGTVDETELERMFSALQGANPRLGVGPSRPCPAGQIVQRGVFAVARPVLKHHHLPIREHPTEDPAGRLVRLLSSPTARDHDVLVQFLWRRVWGWESGFVSPRFDTIAARLDRTERTALTERRRQPPFHLELRAHVAGPEPFAVYDSLTHWLGQFTSYGGAAWRYWRPVPRKKVQGFHTAFATHSLVAFTSRKGARDVSGSELARLLALPWAEHHPECSYAGAPRGRPSGDLVIANSSAGGNRPTVGGIESQRVALPTGWHHLAILGRTQTGKSTLSANLVLQLVGEPTACVIVIEPTGRLIGSVVDRLSSPVAEETIEIDPAHATYVRGETTMVSVPFGLLSSPERTGVNVLSADRYAESLAGDLLAAIRNAWGEESIGGRAELVLRALVQGLALRPDSNLVDAYHILSDKKALARFVRVCPAGPLRSFLERHLPQLDYAFTMSSLDKVGKIATNPILRVALCQRHRPVPFDNLFGHRLLLLNLSKAELGSDGANFLGAVYLTQLWAAAQRRPSTSPPIYLILDEAHNYAVPALADMLSEGAKFGLHVVTVTQYLHRVPPRVRSALLGNVDAWLSFAVGTEDRDDVYEILNGAGHHWIPQDVVDGLGAHEVAFATGGQLLKLTAFPPPGPSADPGPIRGRVTASSRRYAQPEDSQASPWLVGMDELRVVLGAIAVEARTSASLSEATLLTREQADGAVALALAEGDLTRNDREHTLSLTERGRVHREVLEARVSEGEDHVETLTDLAVFLGSRGIGVSFPKQGPGVSAPDGLFRVGSRTYHVEVESTTVRKASDQVIRNLRKARAAGASVLIALTDRESLSRVCALLAEEIPDLHVWSERVGIVWRDAHAFRCYAPPGTLPWPFLTPTYNPPPDLVETPSTPPPSLPPDTLSTRLRSAIWDLVAAGCREATARELLGALTQSEREGVTEERVGRILSALSVPCHRVRMNGSRPRVYELDRIPAGSGPGGRKADSGPVALDSGPGEGTPAGNPPNGPEDSGGPED